MVLSEHFRQRKIEATFSSFRSMVPLTTPSGPQHVESALESELLEQLAFAPGVYDLLTQPIIEYTVDGKPRQYTPDIVVQFHACHEETIDVFIIEVKRKDDLADNASDYAVKFRVAQAVAESMGAAFRIMTEDAIRTPYLTNTRLLRRHLDADPELTVIRAIEQELGAQEITVAEAIVLLRSVGMAVPDIRAGIEQAVAWRLLLCDLALPFTDATIIRARTPGEIPPRRSDPLLRSLAQAESS